MSAAAGLDALPDELLHEILRTLSTRDVLRVGSASRALCEAAWTVLAELREVPFAISHAALGCVARRCPLLRGPPELRDEATLASLVAMRLHWPETLRLDCTTRQSVLTLNEWLPTFSPAAITRVRDVDIRVGGVDDWMEVEFWELDLPTLRLDRLRVSSSELPLACIADLIGFRLWDVDALVVDCPMCRGLVAHFPARVRTSLALRNPKDTTLCDEYGPDPLTIVRFACEQRLESVHLDNIFRACSKTCYAYDDLRDAFEQYFRRCGACVPRRWSFDVLPAGLIHSLLRHTPPATRVVTSVHETDRDYARRLCRHFEGRLSIEGIRPGGSGRAQWPA